MNWFRKSVRTIFSPGSMSGVVLTPSSGLMFRTVSAVAPVSVFAAALMFVAAVMIPRAVTAHGTEGWLVKNALMIEAAYDDGSPMSYCDVSVFSPGRPDSAYVTGTTSEDGRFSFVAPAEGIWKIEVDDGMGHLAVMGLAVGPEGITGDGPSTRRDRVLEAVTGVSVIFGLLGFYYFFRRKR